MLQPGLLAKPPAAMASDADAALVVLARQLLEYEDAFDRIRGWAVRSFELMDRIRHVEDYSQSAVCTTAVLQVNIIRECQTRSGRSPGVPVSHVVVVERSRSPQRRPGSDEGGVPGGGEGGGKGGGKGAE